MKKILIMLLVIIFTNCSKETDEKITSVVDKDGNFYKCVTIGTQVWMAENLKTTKYNDGTTIPNVTNNITWESLSTGAYCWYNNDEVANKNIYGALYNWYSVNTGKLCPTGWHVPSNDEWITLMNYVDPVYGFSLAGFSLKETGTIEAGTGYYFNPNTFTTNESGFSARPGGHRANQGGFFDLGYIGNFWTSTENHSLILTGRESAVMPGSNSQTYGCSVRCLKD